jgi:hypothetical protein
MNTRINLLAVSRKISTVAHDCSVYVQATKSQLDRSLVSVLEEVAHSLGYGHKGYFFAKSCNVIFARGSQ